MSTMQLVGTIGFAALIGGMLLLAAWLIASTLISDVRRHDYEGCALLALMLGTISLALLFMHMMKGGLG